jgi:hypothetical protein
MRGTPAPRIDYVTIYRTRRALPDSRGPIEHTLRTGPLLMWVFAPILSTTEHGWARPQSCKTSRRLSSIPFPLVSVVTVRPPGISFFRFCPSSAPLLSGCAFACLSLCNRNASQQPLPCRLRRTRASLSAKPFCHLSHFVYVHIPAYSAPVKRTNTCTLIISGERQPVTLAYATRDCLQYHRLPATEHSPRNRDSFHTSTPPCGSTLDNGTLGA